MGSKYKVGDEVRVGVNGKIEMVCKFPYEEYNYVIKLTDFPNVSIASDEEYIEKAK